MKQQQQQQNNETYEKNAEAEKKIQRICFVGCYDEWFPLMKISSFGFPNRTLAETKLSINGQVVLYESI